MSPEHQNPVQQIFARAAFIGLLEIELVSFGSGWCEARIRVTPRLEQQHGFVHAGVLMTLADHTCGGAAATMVANDHDVITIDNKFSFLRPALGPVVHCRAQVLNAGKRLAFVEADVRSEVGGERVISVKAISTLAVIPRNSIAPRRTDGPAGGTYT